MLNKRIQLVFQKAAFQQYNILLFDPEISKKVSDFLFRYVLAESYYKSLFVLYSERDGKKMTPSQKKNSRVKYDEVTRVLHYFDISFDESLIDRIFGGNDNNYMDCSIKKLRDRLVHKVNENVVHTILERYDAIERDLNSFFAYFY